jgi:meso-butanediol dehydrogenase/(S,S)-butanediol dehydrogenase/diacetyl reductase
MNRKYQNRVVIITGSAGGLGKEFAIRLLRTGAKVGLSDVNSKLGLETLAELASEFGQDRVCFVACDVTSQDDWKR